MTIAYINRIGTAVPDHDIHTGFVKFARTLLPDAKTQTVFDRMAERAGISHRYSYLRPGRLDAGEVDAGGFYKRGKFPSTAARMALYEPQALQLSRDVVGNRAVAASLDRALSGVRQGRPLWLCLSDAALLAPQAVRLCRIGEETGRLG